jgi:hypothetical protein
MPRTRVPTAVKRFRGTYNATKDADKIDDKIFNSQIVPVLKSEVPEIIEAPPTLSPDGKNTWYEITATLSQAGVFIGALDKYKLQLGIEDLQFLWGNTLELKKVNEEIEALTNDIADEDEEKIDVLIARRATAYKHRSKLQSDRTKTVIRFTTLTAGFGLSPADRAKLSIMSLAYSQGMKKEKSDDLVAQVIQSERAIN